MHWYFRRKSYGGGNLLIVNYLQIHKVPYPKIEQICRKLWRLCRSRYLPQIPLIFTDVLDLISCSPSGSRNLINLIAHFVRSMYSVINCLRSLFRHYANAMTNHRYAIKAHLILTNKSKYRLPLTMCTATFDKIKR